MHKHLFSYRFIAIAILLGMLPSALSIAEPKSNAIYGLNQPIEQIEFRDVTVGDALRILSEQSTLNIVASKEAADIHVTMFLRRATPMEVLDAIAKTYNLWYQRDDNSNIVRLYTVKEYRLEQVEFKKEETEIFTMKNAKNALDLADTIQNLFSNRVKLSYGRNQQEILNELQQRFARFDVVDGRTTQHFSNSNSNSSSSSGTGSSGGQGSSGQTSGNQQSNNQSSGNQNYGQNTANTPSQNFNTATGAANQNNVPSNALTGSSEENSELVDASQRHQAPIYVGVIKHQNRVLVRTRDIDAMNEIRQIHKRLDLESTMLLMEVKVLSIDLSDGYESLFDFKIKTNNAIIASNNAVGTIGATELLDTGIRSAAAATNPALLATVLSNNLAIRLQLMETEKRVTELATPILLTSNQEVSRFFVGSEIPIITGYTPGSTVTNGVNVGNTVVQPSAEYTQRKVGNTLLLTPNINADNTVSINILIEQSSVTKNGATILVASGVGGGLNEQAIDTVQEKTFSGSVIAKDSSTVAVGGLIEEGAGNGENKVPVLGDIPFLGFFFDDVAKTRKRTELVVLIKPHIISSPQEAQTVSQEMLKQNSIHPSAQNGESMDVYSNDSKQFKDYKLEQPYKEYHLQDKFDKKNGVGNTQPATPLPPVVTQPEHRAAPAPSSSSAQQIYVELTSYAAENVRLPVNQRKINDKIKPTLLTQFFSMPLLYDSRIKTLPVAAWHQGGIYVTAFEVRNSTKDQLKVDYRHLKGNWLAATIEKENLNGGGNTYLYLVSAQPFEEVFTSVNP